MFLITTLILGQERDKRLGLNPIQAELHNQALIRKVRIAVRIHLRDCPRCQEIQQCGQAAIETFSQLALIPAPAGLNDLIWGRVSTTIKTSTSDVKRRNVSPLRKVRPL